MTEYSKKYLIPILCKSAEDLPNILEKNEMDHLYNEIRLIDGLCAKILYERKMS